MFYNVAEEYPSNVMDKGYITFPEEVVKWFKQQGLELDVDENNGTIVEGIFDYGCVGDEFGWFNVVSGAGKTCRSR